MERVLGGKRLLKRGLQLLIATVGRQHWYFPYQSLLVLMYHRVLPDSDPALATMQPGMVVRESTFEMQLGVLKEHFTLIHLSDWIKRAHTGKRLPARACAVTFDDGWRDNYHTAFPLLRKYEIPATVFLVADYVGTSHRFWPERLGAVMRRTAARDADTRPFRWLRQFGADPANHASGYTPDEIDQVINSVKRLGDRELTERITLMEAVIGIEPPAGQELLDWGQVREMADSGWVELGSHTRTHQRLGASLLESTIARREVVESKLLLEERLRQPVDLFCYPNGERSEAADTMVRQHYLAACSTRRGWNSRDADPHQIRRIGIHEDVGVDYHAFMARLSGWI